MNTTHTTVTNTIANTTNTTTNTINNTTTNTNTTVNNTTSGPSSSFLPPVAPFLFYSSEVSVCVGQHKYKKRWEGFQDVFQRIHQGKYYQAALNRLARLGHKILNKEERIQQVVSCNHLEDKVTQFLNQPVQTSEELQTTIDSFEQKLTTQEEQFKEQKSKLKEELTQQTQTQMKLEDQLKQLKKDEHDLKENLILWETSGKDEYDPESLTTVQRELEKAEQQLTEIQTNVQQKVEQLSQHEQHWSNFKATKKDIIGLKQTTFGKHKEDSLIASRVLGLVSDNNTQFYKKMLGQTPFGWGICGRIDGFRDGELIEIKNRKSHIYDPLPLYDVIQLQCYMQLLDLQKATLIQSLATENNTYRTHETVVLRDDVQWNQTLLPELNVFVRAMFKFIKDPLLQDKFLQTPDNKKSYLVNSMLNAVRKEDKPVTPPKRKRKASDSSPKHLKSSIMDDFLEDCTTNEFPMASPHPSSTSDADLTLIAANNTNPLKCPRPSCSPPQISTACVKVGNGKSVTGPATSHFMMSLSNAAGTSKSTEPTQLSSAPVAHVTPVAPVRACFFEPQDVPSSVVSTAAAPELPLVQYIPADWLPQLQDQCTQPYFKKLEAFLNQDYQTYIVYPPRPNIFTALHKCPWDQVKVVILAQDPYYNPGEAMGMAFSVPKGVKFPSSLRNIFDELQRDVRIPPPLTGDLTPWAQQGVLLLNTVMTVRAGKADSHADQGWEPFTDFIIRKLSTEKPFLVFLLWGAKAKAKQSLINKLKHKVLETSHPSGLSCNRGFKGCGHFSQTNALLAEKGLSPIEWNVNK